MGYSGLKLGEQVEPKVKSISYTEYFIEACPIFMSYGMSYDEFWYDDLFKARFYLLAHKQKLKEKDEEFYELGMYIYELLLRVAPILRPFSKAEPLPYMEEPYYMRQEKEVEKELTEEQKDVEKLKAQIWLKNLVRMMKNKG